MVLKKIITRTKIAKNKKPVENIAHKIIANKAYTINYAIYPKRKYIELSFLKNNTYRGGEISKFDLNEFAECITELKKTAKTNKIKYLVMNTWIFKEYPKLIDYACKKYNLENYDAKLIKLNLRLNLELYKSRLEEFWFKDNYPTYIFKIKN